MSLSIERKRPIVIEHSRQPSIGLSVCLCACLFVQCIVAKRLIGHECGLGGRSDGSRDKEGSWVWGSVNEKG